MERERRRAAQLSRLIISANYLAGRRSSSSYEKRATTSSSTISANYLGELSRRSAQQFELWKESDDELLNAALNQTSTVTSALRLHRTPPGSRQPREASIATTDVSGGDPTDGRQSPLYGVRGALMIADAAALHELKGCLGDDLMPARSSWLSHGEGMLIT